MIARILHLEPNIHGRFWQATLVEHKNPAAYKQECMCMCVCVYASSLSAVPVCFYGLVRRLRLPLLNKAKKDRCDSMQEDICLQGEE